MTDTVHRGARALGARPRARALAFALALALMAPSPGGARHRHRHYHRPRLAPSCVRVFYGVASWYGPGFHGRRTSSGETFDRNRSTVASRHLAFGTRVRVTYLATGRSGVARVTDRGPYVAGRVIDCSEALARRIGLARAGHGRVRVEVLR